MTETHLLTAEEVAAMLRVSPRTVYDLPGLLRTEIQGRGRRRMVRWNADDVATYIQESRRTGQDRRERRAS